MQVNLNLISPSFYIQLYLLCKQLIRESHWKKSFPNSYLLLPTWLVFDSTRKRSWNPSSLLVQNTDPYLTNVQVSIHDYCWAQTPGATVTRGRVVTVWRSIGVLEKRPFKVRFTTSWNVPPAGSASYTTSLCEYLHVYISIFPYLRHLLVFLHLHVCDCVIILFCFFLFVSLYRWICATRIWCTIKFSI